MTNLFSRGTAALCFVFIGTLAFAQTPAWRAIPGNMWFPHPYGWVEGSDIGGIVATNVTGANKTGMAFMVPKDGTLTHIGFNVEAVIDASGGLRVRLETVGGDGFPSGTLAEPFDSATVDANTPGWYWVALTDGDSVSAGDVAALVVEATDAVDGDYNVARHVNGINLGQVFPYPVWKTGASWSRTAVAPIAGIQIGGQRSQVGSLVVDTLRVYPSTTGWDSASTPDELGLRFQNPVPMRIVGAWVRFRHMGTNDWADHTITLYDNADNVLRTTSVGISGTTSTAPGRAVHWEYFDEITLSANTIYRLTLKPTSGKDITTEAMIVPAAADWDAFPMGQNWYWTERANGGSWTDRTTFRPYMGLIVSQLSAGLSGGGRRRKGVETMQRAAACGIEVQLVKGDENHGVR